MAQVDPNVEPLRTANAISYKTKPRSLKFEDITSNTRENVLFNVKKNVGLEKHAMLIVTISLDYYHIT